MEWISVLSRQLLCDLKPHPAAALYAMATPTSEQNHSYRYYLLASKPNLFLGKGKSYTTLS